MAEKKILKIVDSGRSYTDFKKTKPRHFEGQKLDTVISSSGFKMLPYPHGPFNLWYFGNIRQLMDLVSLDSR